MSDDRSIALTTACDDLQAQLEAGNRSVRLIDDDLTELGALLPSVFAQTAKLTGLLKHMRELRANMLEQRKALREVRAAAKALCATVTTMTTLVEEQFELEEPGAPAARAAGLAAPSEPDGASPLTGQAAATEPDVQSSLAPTPDISKSRRV